MNPIKALVDPEYRSFLEQQRSQRETGIGPEFHGNVCLYSARIRMTLEIVTRTINGKPTLCVWWCLTGTEGVKCIPGNCSQVDQHGWEADWPMSGAWPGGGVLWSFDANLVKCCGECHGDVADDKSYFNSGSECGTSLRYLPTPIANFHKTIIGPPHPSFSPNILAELVKDIVEYLGGGSAQEGWTQDPATKDCHTIYQYCHGGSIL